MFALASQFCGAISTPEWLAYMDYFVRKEYGDDDYTHAGNPAELSSRRRTIDKADLKAEELKMVGMREKLNRFIEALARCEGSWNSLNKIGGI